MTAGRVILIVLLLITIGTACTSEGCYEEIDAEVIVTLFETDSEENLAIDSLTIFGTGLDDSYLYQDISAKSLQLPLLAGSATSSFVIINGLVSDTLTITYKSDYVLVSKACGYSYTFDIESVAFTKNRLDTILIINSKVTPGDEENLRTFF